MDSNVHLDRPWKADHLSILKHISGQKVHKFILPFLPPPHDVFPHCSAGGNFYPPPELNAAQVHSNQYNRHGIHEVEGGLLDQTMSTGRGPFNRKGPGVSTSRERGGTSGVYSAGSTSNSFELHHEKPTSDYRNNFDSSGLPPYMSSSLSIGGEDSPRNVRSRNPAAPPRYLHGFHAQASREGQNSYPRRAIPTYRTDISSSHFGQEATAIENGQHFLSETHNSRYPRPLSEALMMLDNPYLYGSINLFDQYRDMRLDVDSMSYKELLVLGERIGNVNTGLPEDVFSKCLMET
ncbi:hypothetical protein NC652_020390 [Populus alba x Populus x berolinensis]|nr:hypothetical protein NC652_020390 [Populus alba x Populus x berolinensis]